MIDVAVLAGGRSPEHDVSLASVRQVFQHLDRKRWRPWPVFLSRDGGWYPARAPLAAGEAWDPTDASRSAGRMRPGAALDFLLDRGNVKVVLPVLHGPYGEDGTVQGMLELYDLPCVGSGCAASAVAMDKVRTRQVFESMGIPMARGHVPSVPLALADARVEFEALQQQLGIPCVAKLNCSGSSVGVQRIRSHSDLQHFFDEFRTVSRRWFAEELLTGEEITVGVLGNTGSELRALPPVGIYPKQTYEFFDKTAKYTPGETEEVIPPRGLRAAQVAEVQELALACHRGLVCDGMSRTDMIVTKDGPRVLETNTIPGLTGTSLLPQEAAAVGISFPKLLDLLLDLALERAGVAKDPVLWPAPSRMKVPAAQS